MAKRVYEVRENATGKSRLVLAGNASQAIRHVTKNSYSVTVPDTETALRLQAGGTKLETAGADSAAEPDAPSTDKATP